MVFNLSSDIVILILSNLGFSNTTELDILLSGTLILTEDKYFFTLLNEASNDVIFDVILAVDVKVDQREDKPDFNTLVMSSDLEPLSRLIEFSASTQSSFVTRVYVKAFPYFSMCFSQ